MFWLSGSGLFLALAYGTIFYYFTQENYEIFFEMMEMTADAKAQMHKELFQILFYLAGVTGIFFVFVFVAGILFSHRIAGPLYKLKKTCKIIEDGDLEERAFFRTGDEFQDVAQSFNRMLDSVLKQTKNK